MTESIAEGCKHPKPTIEEISLEYIEELFRNCNPPENIGGVVKQYKQPYFKPGDEVIIKGQDSLVPYAGLRVEMTFNDEQNYFARLSLSCLNALIDGKLLISSDRSYPDLSTRIVDNFLERRASRPGFRAAVEDSILDILNDYKNEYTNLIPALKGVFILGGALGLKGAVLRTSDLLNVELNMQRGYTRIKPNRIERKHFARVHSESGYEGRTIDYEVQCIGESVAREIISQAERAAIKLSNKKDVKNRYTALADATSISDLDLKIIKAFGIDV